MAHDEIEEIIAERTRADQQEREAATLTEARQRRASEQQQRRRDEAIFSVVYPKNIAERGMLESLRAQIVPLVDARKDQPVGQFLQLTLEKEPVFEIISDVSHWKAKGDKSPDDVLNAVAAEFNMGWFEKRRVNEQYPRPCLYLYGCHGHTSRYDGKLVIHHGRTRITADAETQKYTVTKQSYQAPYRSEGSYASGTSSGTTFKGGWRDESTQEMSRDEALRALKEGIADHVTIRQKELDNRRRRFKTFKRAAVGAVAAGALAATLYFTQCAGEAPQKTSDHHRPEHDGTEVSLVADRGQSLPPPGMEP